MLFLRRLTQMIGRIVEIVAGILAAIGQQQEARAITAIKVPKLGNGGVRHRLVVEHGGQSAHHRHAMTVLHASDALPIYVDEIRLGTAGGPRVLTGRATGNQATPNQPVTLTFAFWGPSGSMGGGSVTVAAPAKGQSSTFQVPLPDGLISSFSYTYR